MTPSTSPLARSLPLVQGAFFVLTGLWPVVHMQSFLAVTGPKTELWLVQAFGLLVAALGAAFVYSALERPGSRALAVVGFAVSTMLAFIDVLFVAQREIPPVYLLDAAVEAGFALAWVLVGVSAARAVSPNAAPRRI